MGEGALVLHIASIFAVVETSRALGEIGVAGLVVSRLGEGVLPWLLMPLGVISLVVAVLFGGALSRFARGRLFAASLSAIAAILVALWIGLRSGLPVVGVAWIIVMAAGSIAVTMTWASASSSLDTRQAKRLYPLCTAAAIAGYFTGSLLTVPISSAAGGSDVLVGLEALGFTVAAFLIWRLSVRSRASGWTRPTPSGRSVLADARVGFDTVVDSPVLRLVAVAYVLLAVLLFAVTTPYYGATRAAFPDEAQATGAFGLVSAIVAAISFVVALGVANRFYARFGVAAAALLLPVVYLVGFSVWIVAFSFATAASVMVVLQVTQRGLSNAAWSAFYNVAPAARRAQAMAFNDGIPVQIGTFLSGVLMLLAGNVSGAGPLFLLGVVTAAMCVAVVVSIRRRYADALVATLRSGVGEQILEGGPRLGDLSDGPEVRRALLAAMAAPEAPTRETAASVLARSRSADAMAAMATALDDPDPFVRGIAIAAVLGATDDTGHAPEARERAETRLAAAFGGDEADRVAGLRAMDRLGRCPDPALEATLLQDAAPAVRAMTLTTLRHAPPGARDDILVSGLADPTAIVRSAAATALASRDTIPDAVAERLELGSIDEQEAAIAALAPHGADARDAIIAWADRQVARANTLADASSGFAATAMAARDDTARFLADVLTHRIARHERLALGAMAALGAPAAGGVIRRCLRSLDPEIRAQAVEALDSIGDRRLGGSIARLVEHVPSGVVETPVSVVGGLRDDIDPWIRGLARRIDAGGDGMPETAPWADHLDTMLRLRSVPLFERLSPEDLLRVAMVANARRFAAGDVLMREGEIGHEMFVILDGSVVVTKVDDDGALRRLRTYGPGDHVGELAVLRDRVRAATVTAEGGPVSTLAIDGDGLTAILRERPEAAMALLATLAERISAQ